MVAGGLFPGVGKIWVYLTGNALLDGSKNNCLAHGGVLRDTQQSDAERQTIAIDLGGRFCRVYVLQGLLPSLIEQPVAMAKKAAVVFCLQDLPWMNSPEKPIEGGFNKGIESPTVKRRNHLSMPNLKQK